MLLTDLGPWARAGLQSQVIHPHRSRIGLIWQWINFGTSWETPAPAPHPHPMGTQCCWEWTICAMCHGSDWASLRAGTGHSIRGAALVPSALKPGLKKGHRISKKV